MEQGHDITILLVEDDINMGYLLIENLKSKGFNVILAQSGTEALEKFEKDKFDLCILDIMLPGIDGFELAKKLKAAKKDTPFVFLTAKGLETDKLHGFELGADDYIVKPFSFKELYYRLLVILRRSKQVTEHKEQETYEIGSIKFAPEQRIININDEAKKLSQRESALLKMFFDKSGQYITRTEILKTIWGDDNQYTARSMDVYINRIRKLLKDAPDFEVENLYGTGYRIRYDKTSAA